MELPEISLSWLFASEFSAERMYGLFKSLQKLSELHRKWLRSNEDSVKTRGVLKWWQRGGLPGFGAKSRLLLYELS